MFLKKHTKKIDEKELSLDKLAQPRILDKNIKLQKRARAKYLTDSIAYSLYYNCPTSPLLKQYQNTMYCSTNLIIKDNKVNTKYCKNRFCINCNRNRMANNINSYKEPLENLGDLYFVTLSVRTVREEILRKTIKDMNKTFLLIRHNNRKRFNGVKKIETTFRPITDLYHPHFHIIMSGKENAEKLVQEWLSYYPNDKKNELSCAITGQNIKKADSNSFIELFKYTTKIIQQDFDTKNRVIYIKALDIILQAMHKIRSFQSFGTIKIKKETSDTYIDLEFNQELEKYENEEFIWEKQMTDWVSKETGEQLTEYTPSIEINSIIENIKV